MMLRSLATSGYAWAMHVSSASVLKLAVFVAATRRQARKKCGRSTGPKTAGFKTSVGQKMMLLCRLGRAHRRTIT